MKIMAYLPPWVVIKALMDLNGGDICVCVCVCIHVCVCVCIHTRIVKHNISTDSMVLLVGFRTAFFTCTKLIVRGNDPFLLVEITSGIVSPDCKFCWLQCLVNNREMLEKWTEFII